MAKVLVVHSGTFKTGSTAIQTYLSQAQRAGTLPAEVDYPLVGRGERSIQHQNLCSELMGQRAFTPARGTWEELVEHIRTRPATTTVVSCESFSLLGPEHIAAIGEYAKRAGATVRWVHYVRDQASFYNAFYVERVMVMRPEHAGLINQPFEDFREWSPLDMGFLHYGAFAESVLNSIPSVDLRLRPFVRDQLVDGDSVRDFCRASDLPIDGSGGPSSNVGSGWRTVETARRLTPIVAEAKLRRRLKGVDNWAATRLRWVQILRGTLVTTARRIGWNDESAIYMTPDLRQDLLRDYREDNLRVGDLGGFDFVDLVEHAPAPAYNVGDYSSVPADQVMEVVGAVVPLLSAPPQEIQDEIDRATLPDATPSRRTRWARGARKPR